MIDEARATVFTNFVVHTEKSPRWKGMDYKYKKAWILCFLYNVIPNLSDSSVKASLELYSHTSTSKAVFDSFIEELQYKIYKLDLHKEIDSIFTKPVESIDDFNNKAIMFIRNME